MYDTFTIISIDSVLEKIISEMSPNSFILIIRTQMKYVNGTIEIVIDSSI